jgi:hypothetical protein
MLSPTNANLPYAKINQTVWKVASIGFPCAALDSDMTHISGFERSQLLLLPEAIDDYVVADNPVRFIDAFVDGLDLAAAGFKRVTPKVTGHPGYAPGDLLKLYIYGYLNRVRSSRRLGSLLAFARYLIHFNPLHQIHSMISIV